MFLMKNSYLKIDANERQLPILKKSVPNFHFI